jgi:ribonuclease III, bacterial
MSASFAPLPPLRGGGAARSAGEGGQPLPDDLHAFAARWGFAPDSPRLRAALTHRSAAASPAESNERLEFLGDALLAAFVARFLLDSLPPDTDEGLLSRARTHVVRKETLAEAARAMGIADLLAVGPGERKAGRHENDSLLADAYEALVAAQYLDRGAEAMDTFIQATLAASLEDVAAHPPEPDPKTALQMRLQAAGRGLPTYHVTAATGEGQDLRFAIEVRAADGTPLGAGEGPSKRIAQTEAARAALESLA